MGVKCTECGTDNGITMYVGKCCKACGNNIIPGQIQTIKDDAKEVADVQ